MLTLGVATLALCMMDKINKTAYKLYKSDECD
ncbi:MAG: hypothetical protein ACJA2G_001836 [Cognaticolwellia sp.]|jgi:hypothetical protein